MLLHSSDKAWFSAYLTVPFLIFPKIDFYKRRFLAAYVIRKQPIGRCTQG
jgi:hypothetical protein